MEAIAVQELKSVLLYFLKHRNIWAHYDSEGDVLYIQFKKPNHADDSEMTEDEIMVRYENDEVIGLSILNASLRLSN